MRRATWLLSSCLALLVLGPLNPVLTAANAAISRPIVWVSGQDSGQVFITQGTTVLKEFNFVTGLNAPVLPGVGLPTPGLTVASPKPHLIEFSPDGRFAYVSFQNTSPGKVAVIDVATRTVQTIITIPNSAGLPLGASPRVTQAKPSPDGTFLIVTEIGPPGVLTRVNVNEATLTWTVVNQVVVPQMLGLNAGPACTSFSPDGSVAYVDSSLSPFLGVMTVNPSTLVASVLFQTAGDPQCGIHNAFDLNGTPVIVVTDNGAAPTVGNPRLGHVHVINAVTGTFTEPAPSPIPAANLHDNWPVGLQPAGATTTDPPNTVYATDRDNTGLHQIQLGAPFGTPSDSTLLLVDPNVAAAVPAGCGPLPNPTPCTFQPRGAPDTLDGSGDTVFVAMKEAGDLGIIDNFGTQTYLHLVDPDPSCGTVGNANFHKCFAVHAVTVQPSATTLSCSAGTSPSGAPLDVCTLSDPDGIASFQVKNTATNAQQVSLAFDCATAPTTVQFKVPANTKYKVFVTDCKVPANKTTYVIRANGGVNTV